MWRKALIASLSALLLGVPLAVPADAAPKPPRTKPQYVALGDSYAAGNGAGSYLIDGTGCYRSLLGYPGRVAASGNLALNLQACSGATTTDVLNLQLGTLSATTAYVTITVGGNDIGFADVITTCLGSNTTACLAAVTAAEAVATTDLPDRLAQVFSRARTQAPSARIVATSYPRLFNGRDCSLLTDFTSTEMTRLNQGADTLATVIAAAAANAGIGYTDVRTPFVGHAVCDSTPWIHNASLFEQYKSFHANADGYRYGYAPGVAKSLGVSTGKPAKPTVTTGGTTSSDTTRGHVRIPKQN